MTLNEVNRIKLLKQEIEEGAEVAKQNILDMLQHIPYTKIGSLPDHLYKPLKKLMKGKEVGIEKLILLHQYLYFEVLK